MDGYLGEFNTDERSDWTKEQWSLKYIMSYGGIDGSHHKDWVLDQVARILHGTIVICTEARWEGGHVELRFTTGEPTQSYLDWVAECRGEYNEEYEGYEYEYSEGIAP